MEGAIILHFSALASSFVIATTINSGNLAPASGPGALGRTCVLDGHAAENSVLALIAPPPPPLYSLSDLGTFGGESIPFGINSRGDVVGYVFMPQQTRHAFLYSAGVMRDLGTFGGDSSYAYGINDSGQVVGSAEYAGDAMEHAFVYKDGVMTDIGTLGGTYSQARKINALGQIVGRSYLSGNTTAHAFMYSNGSMQDLGTLGGGASQALGVNDAGVVVGSAWLANNAGQHAFAYAGGVMRDLGTLGGMSEAWAINNSGVAVGDSETSNTDQFSALFSGGQVTNLGNFGGNLCSARAINSAGEVVGGGDTLNGVYEVNYLYSNGQLWDINLHLDGTAAGWHVALINSINDSGWIAGCAENSAGNFHAVLLKPSGLHRPPSALPGQAHSG